MDRHPLRLVPIVLYVVDCLVSVVCRRQSKVVLAYRQIGALSNVHSSTNFNTNTHPMPESLDTL